MSESQPQERRQYFRIDDVALVNYRALDDRASDSRRGNVESRAAIVAAVESIDLALIEFRERHATRHPELCEGLALLNRKQNLITQGLLAESGDADIKQLHLHQATEINLSGGGMAVRAGDALELDLPLAVDLILLPDYEALRLDAKVVGCRKLNAGEFSISIAFENLSQACEDRIVAHVLARQAEKLRAQKHAALDV